MSNSTYITIQEWIQYSQKKLDDQLWFLNAAIDLATPLTNRLSQMMAAGEVKHIYDVREENISLRVIKLADDEISIISVHFGISSHQQQPGENSPTALQSGALCVALGRILLRIFTRGQSPSLEGGNHESGSGEDKNTSSHYAASPANKRKTVGSIASGTSGIMERMLQLGLPSSVCRLVCDLLTADNRPKPSKAFSSIEETLYDLKLMKNDPKSFLMDRSSPQEAVGATRLFGGTGTTDSNSAPAAEELFGREKELEALLGICKTISSHVTNTGIDDTVRDDNDSVASRDTEFRSECVFLSGHAGMGKSSIVRSIMDTCVKEDWFVLNCKFGNNMAPHLVMASAFEQFFDRLSQKRNGKKELKNALHRVVNGIVKSVDSEGFVQLCDIVPKISTLYPMGASIAASMGGSSQDNISSLEKVGAAEGRRLNLFQVMLKSLTSAGIPVLFVLDDLQWSGKFAMKCIANFVITSGDIEKVTNKRQGLMVLGTYRTNEVPDVVTARIDYIKDVGNQSGRVTVTEFRIGSLSKDDTSRLISTKLCLPLRYVRELAGLVRQKTRGHPYHIQQFLRRIIQSKYLQYSVRTRTWEWDLDIIDMQMISDGVVELLTSTLTELPPSLIKTLKITSCLGVQFERRTIEMLDEGNTVLQFNMMDELESGINEGLLENAGPIFQFTHDILQSTIYDSIPKANRTLLHKIIGKKLLESSVGRTEMDEIHILAADQINSFIKNSEPLDADERLQYANLNFTAARISMGHSGFDQSQSYIDIGIRLLNTDHWETQYTLSLGLYEMAAQASYTKGDTLHLSDYLDEILSHSRCFEDSLTASSLLVKFLASTQKFNDAISNCLVILANMGYEFPTEVELDFALSKLTELQASLSKISRDTLKQLPRMTDRSKLNAMKFMSLLCQYCIIAKPELLALVSFRMMQMTLDSGFCDDSIVGLAVIAYSLFSFTQQKRLGYKVGKMCESLVEESDNKHALRSRLVLEMSTSLRMAVEPVQSIVSEVLPSVHDSAIQVGDIENAMQIRSIYCTATFFIGKNLETAIKHYVNFFREAAKYKEHTYRNTATPSFWTSFYLSGLPQQRVENAGVNSPEELETIATNTNDKQLQFQIYLGKVCTLFWTREFKKLVELSESREPSGHKRLLEVFDAFYVAIAAMHMARRSGQMKWRAVAENTVGMFQGLSLMSNWNFDNKFKLLRAELLYVDGDLQSAETEYKAAILSAKEHKVIHEEGLSLELFGMFLVEIGSLSVGIEQLGMALDRYKQWGAMTKVRLLETFISDLTQANFSNMNLCA